MTCLNDSLIQALADGEPLPEAAQHAAGCARCADRVRARGLLMAAVERELAVPAAVPPSLARSVEGSFRHGGGTRLRESRGFRLNTSWLYSGLAVAAATVIGVLFITPAIRTPDATVSASEILAKSASQLSAAVTSGVEVLEYELVLDGVPKEMLPDQVDGTYTVWQAIDHNVPGRFRFASYAQSGQMITSIAEDPLKQRRVAAFMSEGQPYRFDVSLPAHATNLSLPEMQRLHMQASITMMQANGNQLLETIDGPNGKQYRIEVPSASAPGTNPVWDLTEARVLVDARDYRVVEFAVRGSFLKQAYSMSYKQITHTVTSSVPPGTFDVPLQPGEIVITGEGSAVPTHDIVVLALRELTKLKQGR